MKEKTVHMLEFPQKGDERGDLIVVEGGIDISFDIKRIFYMYGSDAEVVRGQHANKRTEFVLINVAGQSKVRVKDGKGNEAVFSLNRPNTGIYIPNMVWKDMYDFSEDSVMICLASEHYDAEEYIRDYDKFIELIREDEELDHEDNAQSLR
jgi:dTDP-4-dehydrorhamnose 3,5-epimerase-like enzyme